MSYVEYVILRVYDLEFKLSLNKEVFVSRLIHLKLSLMFYISGIIIAKLVEWTLHDCGEVECTKISSTHGLKKYYSGQIVITV